MAMAESPASYAPTIRGIPDEEFNPEADAQFLNEAMRGLGTNDRQLITLITDRTNAQRLAIAQSYEEQFEKSLVDRIRGETSGKYERVLVGLMIPPAHYDAYFLRQAMDGVGTTESLLNEILCTRMGSEIEAIKVAFEEQCGKNLADRVANEIGFGNKHYERFLLRCINDPRPDDGAEEIDEEAVAEDAARLSAAGVEKWGTDEGVFIDIFASRSFEHLKRVCIMYQSTSDKQNTLEYDVKSELSGNFEDAILATLGHAFRPSDFWGEKLKDTMKGLGTDDEGLIRILVSRSERDLATIRDNFGTDFGEGKALEAWVAGDTSGNYEGVLLAIIGADQREPIRTEGDDAEVLEEYPEPEEPEEPEEPAVEPEETQAWERSDGGLTQITTVRTGEFYGVNEGGAIWVKQEGAWSGLPGALKQIDCGGPDLNSVWGVNVSDQIYRLNSDRQWEMMPGGLSELSVGNQGQVWGVNSVMGVWYYLDGYTHVTEQDTNAEKESTQMAHIACDAITGQVYAIGPDEFLYVRMGVDEDNLIGEEWQNTGIEGLVGVSACAGKLVCLTNGGTILDVNLEAGPDIKEVNTDDFGDDVGAPISVSVGVEGNLAVATESQAIFMTQLQ